VETGSEERGWNPLGNAKQRWGEPQIALESPKPPVGGVGRKRVQVRVEKWSRGINTQGTGLVQWSP
jgi:hypothetical protein